MFLFPKIRHLWKWFTFKAHLTPNRLLTNQKYFHETLVLTEAPTLLCEPCVMVEALN